MANFPSMLAQDEFGVLAQGLVGQVYDVDDVLLATPLDIYDKNGAAFSGSQLVSGPNGVLPEFSCPGYTVVRWVSGPFRMDIPCIDQVPEGGLAGQVLAKASDLNYDLEWVAAAVGGGGGGTVASAYGINVKDVFGAVGDGLTDDTAAIQAALDSVPVGGALVYFPAGDYLVSSSLRVETEGTMLVGDGPGNRTGATQSTVGTRLRATTGITGQVVKVQRVADDRPLHGVHFRDLSIDGNHFGTAVDGVLFRSNQGSMVNVNVWNCTGVGLRVKGYSTPAVWDTYDSQFVNVKVGYCDVAGGFLDSGGADTQWVNCVFLSNYDNFVVKGSSPQVSNTHFYTAGRRDIWFDGNGSRGKFNNCKIEGGTEHTVYIDTTNGGYSDVQFTGCGFSSMNQSSTTNTYDYVYITGPSGTGASRFTFVGNSFNLKGGNTVKARYAINATGSTVQNLMLLANSFGPASHWGTAPFNQGSSSTLLPFVRGNWGLPDLVLPNVQTASYTATVADCDTPIEMNSATAVNVTIPPNAQPGFQKGATLVVTQVGAGQVTLVAGSGVTLQSPGGLLKTRVQYSRLYLRQRQSNVWIVDGDLG